MFQLQFDVMGDQQVMRGFSKLADGVKDLREPFREMVKDFREIEKRQFSSQGGYGSGGWKPLKTSTALQKQRLGYPAQILVRSGELRDVMTGLRSGYDEVQPLEMKIMTLSFGKYHQKGTSRMEARPLVQLTEDDKTRWSKIIHLYLVQLARKEFAGLMPTIGAGTSHLKAIQKE
jgi:phage gpG-like protein